MNLIKVFIAIPVLVILLIPFFRVKGKGMVFLAAIVFSTLLSGYFAIQTLFGGLIEITFPGSVVTGLVNLRIDALSAWFILIINFVFVTGGFYGLFYMKAYEDQRNNISLHGMAFLLLHWALLALCAVQNSLVFLIVWEIMALSAFFAVIFEHEKMATLKAGLNYLIQSHVSILLLMFGFIWVAFKTGSYDFNALTTYTSANQGATGIFLFFFFFAGFGIKAGFVPFHTWLPYAHPAAPAHVSGVMSGVMIKIGIFGILRMITLIQADYYTIGLIILAISVISGLYGVMLAIMQHNLKKLLAYHSIENIGIIGMGIGIGCIGLGTENPTLATLGFAGALLHTLNHALFKSLLFYTAGNVYLATHTLQIDHLGGLIKKMPQTAALFLIAAIAISGIPPFNGFISEFIIYSGFYYWMQNAMLGTLMTIIFSVLALVLIGGLALLCFTKAFGIVFLGQARQKFNHEVKEVPFLQLLPLYLIAFFIVFIGVFPQFFLNALSQPVHLLSGISLNTGMPFQGKIAEILQPVTWGVWIFILITLSVFFLRKFILKNRKAAVEPTWGCAFVAPTEKLQYTASSFVRSYSKLFRPILLSSKNEKEVKGIFPSGGSYETHVYDRIERYFIDHPLAAYRSLLGRFLFLQNGKLQFYILYGIIFIVSVICVPLFYDQIVLFIEFIKQI
ncbi:MAG TPA: proton-conducting transporter membrane subunit [Prolixibacteraceae bacterium]|nr:proton-conducting transporter membrane subunit [Prolixibacteraceae bacterium]